MREIDIQDHARKLFEALGDRAIAEAAQKARAFEEQGKTKKPTPGGASRKRCL
jgi:hypothetical protein